MGWEKCWSCKIWAGGGVELFIRLKFSEWQTLHVPDMQFSDGGGRNCKVSWVQPPPGNSNTGFKTETRSTSIPLVNVFYSFSPTSTIDIDVTEKTGLIHKDTFRTLTV